MPWIKRDWAADWFDGTDAAPEPAAPRPDCCDPCRQYYDDIGGADKEPMLRCFCARQHSRKRPPPPQLLPQPDIWETMSLGSSDDDRPPGPPRLPEFRAAPIVELKQRPLRSETEPGWWKRRKQVPVENSDRGKL